MWLEATVSKFKGLINLMDRWTGPEFAEDYHASKHIQFYRPRDFAMTKSAFWASTVVMNTAASRSPSRLLVPGTYLHNSYTKIAHTIMLDHWLDSISRKKYSTMPSSISVLHFSLSQRLVTARPLKAWVVQGEAAGHSVSRGASSVHWGVHNSPVSGTMAIFPLLDSCSATVVTVDDGSTLFLFIQS